MSKPESRKPVRGALRRSDSAKISAIPSYGWFTGALGAPRCLRAALYARVSTGDQQTLPMQLKALRRYAGERAWSVVNEVREIGSGAKARPQREEIVRAARRSEIDVVIVWKLDRWGRMMAGLLAVFAEFEQEVRRERILAGIAEARAKGVHLGRPPKVIVRLAALREARAEGKTISAIAREFHIARSTVRAYLDKNKS